MKALALTLLIATSAQAFEWEAGVRELFLTRQTYSYNSDSSSRIRRELFDRGYTRISIQPRIAYTGDSKSLFYLPPVKSSLTDLGVMNTRISQANGYMTLKPIIYANPDLGEAKPVERINPLKADVALVSYGQILSQYAQLARHDEIDRMVVGTGLVHLLNQDFLVPKFELMLKGIRKSVGPKTELLLEVVGAEDLKALAKAVSPQTGNLDLSKLVNGLSIVLEPGTHFPGGSINIEEVKKTRLDLETLLPGMPIHLSRVVVPGCNDLTIVGGEYYCATYVRDIKVQLTRFSELKKALLVLEKEGFIFRTVEIMESNTDFEPGTPDPRYPYYNPLFNDLLNYELPKKPMTVLPPYPMADRSHRKTACIYYDKNDTASVTDRVGDIHSVMLESVLGAFKNWKVKRDRVKNYVQGDIASCHALFYFGTNFAQELPAGFADEAALLSSQIPVVWFNYKFPLLNLALKNINVDPGFDAAILMQPDSAPSPTNTDPGFFRYFDYKGETFFKLAQWNPSSNNFAASPELHYINVKDPQKVEILSTSRHSKTNQTVPYAVRSGNIWYIADSPFSFVHYEDRFYIFTDFLWDMLGETPPTERIALARIEDVGPNLDLVALRWAMDHMFQENVPFSLGVIPYYSDLIGAGGPDFQPIYKSIDKYPGFVAQLKYAKMRGASIVMHGSAHAVGSLISGYDGVSGGDYEFWLYPENRPLPFDSIDWVTRRLEMGINVLQKLKLEPAAFEVPHYAASVMNYVVFGKMFRWNYHRTIYFPNSISTNTALPPHLQSGCNPKICGDERRAVLSNLRIEADYSAFGGMTLPFITHRDAYGQSLIPETLGMIDFAFYDSNTWRPVSKPEDVLRRAKKLKVIRGAVASFFWHPQLLNAKSRYYQEVPGSFELIGGKQSLILVIEGLKKLGYEFKSIEDKTYFPDEEVL